MNQFAGRSRRREHGQAIVIMVVAMIAALAMVSLIVDGGNAWAQQRITQNGTDSAANAGATVLARRLAGEAAFATGPAADTAAKAAVDAMAGANGIVLSGAYYTDICGVMLRPNGTKANTILDAAVVGAGDLPADIGQTPDCPSGQTGPVAGVRAMGSKPFTTFIAPIIGITDLTAGADATAVTGYLQGLCEPEDDEGCVVLPVTFPTTVTTCDGQGDLVTNPNVFWTKNVRVIVPLCKNDPGNVGWLDWTPPGGGASELEDAIIPPPYNDPIDLPSWQYVTQTGNTNSKPVEDALNYWAGQIVYIPMFDLTCGDDPDVTYVDDPQSPPGVTPPTGQYGCLNGDVGGSGQNQWYRIPQVAAFELEQAYINGSNSECTTSASNSTSCLIGKFVDIISTGTVGPGGSGGTGETSVIGVQLIK